MLGDYLCQGCTTCLADRNRLACAATCLSFAITSRHRDYSGPSFPGPGDFPTRDRYEQGDKPEQRRFYARRLIRPSRLDATMPALPLPAPPERLVMPGHHLTARQCRPFYTPASRRTSPELTVPLHRDGPCYSIPIATTKVKARQNSATNRTGPPHGDWPGHTEREQCDKPDHRRPWRLASPTPAPAAPMPRDFPTCTWPCPSDMPSHAGAAAMRLPKPRPSVLLRRAVPRRHPPVRSDYSEHPIPTANA